MYKLLIFPDYDFIEEDVLKLKKLIKQIERDIGKEIGIILPKNYKEGIKNYNNLKIDIAFSNPVLAQNLYREGFIPFEFLWIEKKDLVIIGDVGKIENKIVSLPFIENYFYSILAVDEIDLLKSKIIYTQTEKETFDLFKNKVANLAIVSNIFYEKIRKLENIPVFKKLETKIPHFLMFSPDFYGIYKEKIERLEGIKKLSPEEFKSHYSLSLNFNSIYKVKQFYDTAKSVYQSPFIGTIVYTDKILYASNHVRDIFEFEEYELKSMDIENLFIGEDREKIKEEKLRRLEGDIFLSYYPECKIITKKGEVKFVKAFIKTTIYEGKFASLMVIIDVTKEIKFQRMCKVLREVNQAITTVLTEEELFSKICNAIIKDLNIKFAWLGIYDEDGKTISKIFKCGIEENFLTNLGIYEGLNVREQRNNQISNYNKDKITINERSIDISETQFKNSLLLRDFLSSVTIPIIKFDKQIGTLNIYSSESSFFDEDSRSILYDMQHDIKFALEKIDTIRNSIITTKALEKSKNWLMITDEDGKILYVNDFIIEKTKYSKEEILGKKPNIFKSGYQDQKFYKNLWKTIKKGEEFDAIFVNKTKDGEIFYLEQSIIPVNLEGKITRYISIGKDITTEKNLSFENEKLRFYDSLTGLYNKYGFSIKVQEILKSKEKSALILIDIYNFSYINKYYGTHVGDEILKRISKNLTYIFEGKNAFVGRIGGDEFAVFLYDITDKDSVYISIEKIKHIFDKELRLKKSTIAIKYNIGVSIYPSDAKNFEGLSQNAVVALKNAKLEGANKFKFFNKNIDDSVKELVNLEDLISTSLKEKRFVFYYQPYFSAEDRKLAGFETLVSIKRDDGSIIPASKFIDFLENSVYIYKFQEFAINYLKDRVRIFSYPISINLSAKSFEDLDYFEKLLKIVSKIKKEFVIEITERIFLTNTQERISLIKKLKDNKNVKIAIDDFGTGYSSLSYISDIEPDIIKIDISFIRRIPEDKKVRTLVQSIINLSKFLGIHTVAEGVENETQYNALKYFGVDYIQGFYMSKPIPEEDALKL